MKKQNDAKSIGQRAKSTRNRNTTHRVLRQPNREVKRSTKDASFLASLTRKQVQLLIIGLVVLVVVVNVGLIFFLQSKHKEAVKAAISQESYWFLLHRKSGKEYFYRGIPGDPLASRLLKTFPVKTGIPEERPTPLPQKVGREYWLVVSEQEQFDNPETAPYFLTLNIPVGEEEPFGPTPYTECGGQQCNWILPGAFGLHGTASDSSKLAPENPGSSGCIRHRDEDITYLYNLLDPKKEEIRYYIEDI